MRNRYRLTFAKYGAARFIGHLDLQTLFQRAVKRAKLPIAFSKGFNPHQLIGFAQPLPLGMSSRCELAEIELAEEVDVSLITVALNGALPDGLEILSSARMEPNSKSAAALVISAAYEVIFPFDETLERRLGTVLAEITGEDEIIVSKRTKKGIADTDIRPDIHRLGNISGNGRIAVRMLLSAGSDRSLKAELVAKLICDRCGAEFQQYKISYARTDLFLKQ